MKSTDAAYFAVAEPSVPQAAPAAHRAGNRVFEKTDMVFSASALELINEFTSAILIIAIAAQPPNDT